MAKRIVGIFSLCLSGKKMQQCKQAKRCAPLLRTLPTISTSRLPCAVWTAVVFVKEFRGPS